MSDYQISVALVANDEASPVFQNLRAQLEGVTENTEGLTDAASNNTNAIGDLATAAIGLGVAWAGAHLVDTIADMTNLGSQVHATSAAFGALQGSPEAAAASINTLRTATHGIVDDMTIMQESNRMMSMGLSDSADGIGELMNMAVMLGNVMSPGSSAQANIDNFTLMLANQSVKRLDTFGISASAVRDRMEELKQAGMDAQEAFTQATLEQGRISLERLGSAADASITNVDRLQVRWQNFWEGFSEQVAGAVNQLAGVPDTLGGYMDFITHNQGLGGLFSGLSGLTNPYSEAAFPVSSTTVAPIPSTYMQTGGDILGSAANSAIASNPSAYQMSADAEQARIDYVAAKDAMFGIKDAASGVNGEMQQWHSSSTSVVSDLELARQHTSAILSDMELTVVPVSQITGLMAQGADSATATQAAVETALSTYNMQGFSTTTTYGGVTGTRGDIGGQQLFTQVEADQAQTISDYYSNLLDDATQLHEQGLITDAELANVQSTADAASALADNAQRGAEAFQNMTLAQAFGQTSGGMGGEVQGDVTQYMRDNGYSDQQIAQFTNTTQLATGQQTQSSMAYDNTIVPMIAQIASQYGADAAAQAVLNVQSGMQTAAMTGMSDSQIANNMAGMTGYTSTQASAMGFQGLGTNTQGETLQQNDQFSGIDDYMQSVSEGADSMQDMAESAKSAKTSMESLSTSATRAQVSVASIASGLRGLPTTHRLNIELVATSSTPWLHEMISAEVGKQMGGTSGGQTGHHPGTGGE